MNETINKKMLVDAVATTLNVSKKQAGEYVEVTLHEIIKALSEGTAVDLSGFGKFEVRVRAAREGFNPQSKEKIQIPASKGVAFRPAKAMKEAIK